MIKIIWCRAAELQENIDEWVEELGGAVDILNTEQTLSYIANITYVLFTIIYQEVCIEIGDN